MEKTTCDYLGIGAGPVQLAAAAHFKLSQAMEGKDVEIVLLDKREKYTRGHTVYLDPKVVQNIALKTEKIADEALKKAQENSIDLQGLAREFNGLLIELQKNTPILDIEKKLAQFAEQKLGITIHRGGEYEVSEEQPLSGFIDKYSPKFVVAAGGYRCAATQQVFGAMKVRRARKHENLTYMLKAKFKVDQVPNTSKRDKLGTMVQAGRFVSDAWFSKTAGEDGKYKGQAFTTATAAEVAVIERLPTIKGKVGTYMNPLIDISEDGECARASGTGLNLARKVFDKEFKKLKAKNLEIVVIRLGAYKNKEFIKMHQGVRVVALGDAAAGVPYQRSLCGSYLTIAHATELFKAYVQEDSENKAENINKAEHNFSKKVHAIWDKEVFAALWKARGLYLLDCIAWTVRAILISLVVSVVGYGLYRLKNAARKKSGEQSMVRGSA